MRAGQKRFFLLRPESVAAKARLASGAAIPVKLLHIGPAMPTAFETDVAPVPALPAQIGQGVATTVITGVVDDVMGFANERFRRVPNGSRVERFWMQGMPAIQGGNAAIGGEIDRAAIDALLQSVPMEQQVYDRLFPKGVYVIRRAPRGELGLTPYESLNSRPFGFSQTPRHAGAGSGGGLAAGPCPGGSPDHGRATAAAGDVGNMGGAA